MQHLSEKTQFPGFLFPQVVQKHLLCEVETEKVKYLLIAYFLANNFATNRCNRAVYVQIIASQRWDVL